MCIYRVLRLGISILCLTNYSACCGNTIYPHCKTSIFSDKTFIKKIDVFSVYEQVYVKIYRVFEDNIDRH